MLLRITMIGGRGGGGVSSAVLRSAKTLNKRYSFAFFCFQNFFVFPIDRVETDMGHSFAYRTNFRKKSLTFSNTIKIFKNIFSYLKCIISSCANRINGSLVLFDTSLRRLSKCILNNIFIVNKLKMITI